MEETLIKLLLPVVLGLINGLTSLLKKPLPRGKKHYAILIALAFSSLLGVSSSHYGYQLTIGEFSADFLTGSLINTLILFLMSVGIYSVFESFRHSDADLYDLTRIIRRAGIKKGVKAFEVAEALMAVYISFDKIKQKELNKFETSSEYTFNFLTESLEMKENKAKFIVEYLNILHKTKEI